MVYAVIDTNVFVAAFLSRHEDSSTVRVMRALGAGRFVPLYSDEIIEEYREVLSRPKFGISEDLVDALINKICELGESAERICAAENFIDEDDRVFYEVTLSHAAQGAMLVTGNARHYPKKNFIVTAAEFAAIVFSGLDDPPRVTPVKFD